MRCVYLVARGTLDEVLWQLIEKKFRDLGEFVEGKEKHKLVVDNVIENNAELFASLFDSPVVSDTDGDDCADSNDMEDLQLSFADIAELGAEERKMLLVDGEDGEQSTEQSQHGQTEVTPIMLVDDDDDMDKKPAARMVCTDGIDNDEDDDSLSESKVAPPYDTRLSGADAIPKDSILYGCRLYKVIFSTPTLGISLRLFHGRTFIFRVSPQRREALGVNCKPEIGDILVSVEGYPLPLHNDIDYLLNFTKFFLKNPPIEMHFVAAPRAALEFLHDIETPAVVRAPIAANEVIELLDDD